MGSLFTLDCGGSMGHWECDDGIWLVANVVSSYQGPCWAISLEGLLLAGDAKGCMKIWRFLTPDASREALLLLESDAESEESDDAASFEEDDEAAMAAAQESGDDMRD